MALLRRQMMKAAVAVSSAAGMIALTRCGDAPNPGPGPSGSGDGTGGGDDTTNTGGDNNTGGGDNTGGGGNTTPDAGGNTPSPDAGNQTPDAGNQTPDAGNQTPDAGAKVCQNGTTATIGTNHTSGLHTLTVSAADVQAGVAKTYNIQGASGHPHTVTITAVDFTNLGRGMQITKVSSRDANHTHTITVVCK